MDDEIGRLTDNIMRELDKADGFSREYKRRTILKTLMKNFFKSENTMTMTQDIIDMLPSDKLKQVREQEAKRAVMSMAVKLLESGHVKIESKKWRHTQDHVYSLLILDVKR